MRKRLAIARVLDGREGIAARLVAFTDQLRQIDECAVSDPELAALIASARAQVQILIDEQPRDSEKAE